MFFGLGFRVRVTRIYAYEAIGFRFVLSMVIRLYSLQPNRKH